MTISDDDFKALLENYGLWTLAYVLNCSVSELETPGDFTKSTSTEQDQVILHLCAILKTRERTTPQELPNILQSELSQLIDRRISVGNALRGLCHGQTPRIPENVSPAERCLWTLTESAYPALLADYNMHHDEENISANYWSYDMYSNLANNDLCDWLHDHDNAFSDFSGDEGNLIRYAVHSTGMSGSTQLNTLAMQVINTAWIASLHSGDEETPPDFATLFEEVRTVFEEVRNGLSTGEYRSFVLVGLSGVILPAESQSASLQGVEILPWQPADARFSSVFDDRYYSTSTASMSKEVQFHYHGDVVVKIPITLKVAFPEHAEEHSSDLFRLSNELRHEINRKVRLVQLALLLSQPTIAPAGRWVWQTVIDPLSNGSGVAYEPKSPYSNNQGSLVLTVQNVENWRIWLERFLGHEQGLKKLSIGIRHLLSAVNEREDTDDKLLDAVVAWENLFGVKQQTTFRVTAALACLLDQEPSVYKGKQKQLSKIYDVRSRVIHGSAKAQHTKARYEKSYQTPAYESAISVAVAAYRTVLTSHVDLLACADSEKRNSQILEGKAEEVRTTLSSYEKRTWRWNVSSC
jgi:hypothetical protein